MKIQSLISVLVLTCAIMLLASEKKSVLTGQIQDETGFGITSGSLEIYTNDAKHKLVHTAEIDENGCYQMTSLPEGEYEVVVKSEGYEDTVEKVKVENSYGLGTIIMKNNYITLDEAVIYGQAPEKDFVLLDTAIIYGKVPSDKKSVQIAKN